MDSILRFGFRSAPGMVNTPLVTNVFEAEIVGIMMLMKSQANRYSGSLTIIEDSAIKVGNPIRVHLYDEHPMKELTVEGKGTGMKFDKIKFPEQAVFYVVGIERNIDINNVSTMTLQLKAGRMMGKTSIYDICMPLYKYFYDEYILAKDFTKTLENYKSYYDPSKSPGEGNYKIEKISENDSFAYITRRHYTTTTTYEQKRDLFYAIILLNPKLFGISAQFSNSTVMDQILASNPGAEIKLPSKIENVSAGMSQNDIYNGSKK